MRLHYLHLHEGVGLVSYIPGSKLHFMANALALGLGEIISERLRPEFQAKGDDLTIEATSGDSDEEANLIVSTDLGREVELDIHNGSVFVGGRSHAIRWDERGGGPAPEMQERSLEEDDVIDEIVNEVRFGLGI